MNDAAPTIRDLHMQGWAMRRAAQCLTDPDAEGISKLSPLISPQTLYLVALYTDIYEAFSPDGGFSSWPGYVADRWSEAAEPTFEDWYAYARALHRGHETKEIFTLKTRDGDVMATFETQGEALDFIWRDVEAAVASGRFGILENTTDREVSLSVSVEVKE